MQKKFVLYVLVLLNSAGVHAQRVRSDSIGSRNVHSKRDSFVLNPEIQDAINQGIFSINTESKKINSTQQSSSLKMPVQADFSEYIKPKQEKEDEFLSKIKKDVENLPPQVFWLYFPELDDPKRKIGKQLLNFMGEVKQIKVPKGHDFNDVLSTLLDPHYRQLKKNKKNAVAYKTYNDLPTKEFTKKQQDFFEKHPEIVLPEKKAKAILVKKDSIVEKIDSVEIAEIEH